MFRAKYLYKVVLGSTCQTLLYKVVLESATFVVQNATGKCWGVFCASVVVQSGAGKCLCKTTFVVQSSSVEVLCSSFVGGLVLGSIFASLVVQSGAGWEVQWVLGRAGMI